jgi:hypothetical protein
VDLRQRRIILVKDLSPSLVNLVNLIPIPDPITIALCSIQHLCLPRRLHLLLTRQGQRHVLDASVRYINSESLDSPIGPESKGGDEIVSDFLVFPIEVGLGSIE